MTPSDGTRLPRSRGPRREQPWGATILVAALGTGSLLGNFATTVYRRPEVAHAPGGGPVAGPGTLGAVATEPVGDVPGRPSGARPGAAAAAPAGSARERPALDVLLARLRKRPVGAQRRAAYVRQVLQDLHLRGASAVAAIGDFLRRGDDVDFAKDGSSALIGARTLREALIAALQQIGGSAAMAVALEQLQQTRAPVETVMLARGLEAEEPGVHTERVMEAIDETLRWAGEARESPDVSPLFELLRGYGGDRAVAMLQRCVPQWGEYALIALAGLPGEQGISTLTSLATTPDVRIDNPVLPFQALAQATTDSPETAGVLVDLARSGQIPDQAWAALGDVLGGKYLRFSRTMFDGTALAEPHASDSRPTAWKSYYIEWMNVRYEQDVVTDAWSAERVQRQLALIDELLDTTGNPVAVQALERARMSLLF